jgi:hypothetical protein
VPYRTDAPSPLAASKQTGRRPPHAAAKKKTPKRRIRDGRTHQQPRPGGHQLVGLPQQFCREFVSRGRVSNPAHRRVWSGRRSQPSARTTSPVTTPPQSGNCVMVLAGPACIRSTYAARTRASIGTRAGNRESCLSGGGRLRPHQQDTDLREGEARYEIAPRS